MDGRFGWAGAVLLALFVIAGCSSDVDNPTQPPPRNGNPSDGPLIIPAGGSVQSARLRLYCTEPSGGQVFAHRATAEWGEGATWSSFGEGFSAERLDSAEVDAEGWIELDVTAAVSGWVQGHSANYGLVLTQDSAVAAETGFHAREHGTRGPWLDICYMTNGSRICEALGVAFDAHVREDAPDSAFARGNSLKTGGGGARRRTLLRFAIQTGTAPSTSIGDRVWNDANQNGIQDAGEGGVGGATVQLLRCDSTLVQSRQSGADGSYRFNDLEAGEYRLRITPPTGWTRVSANQGGDDERDSDAGADGYTECTVLDADEEDLSWDFGLHAETQTQRAAIGDRVWNDLDGDGVQDGGEPGIQGVLVRLVTCAGQFVGETRTDGNGNYRFGNLVPGDYRLRFIREGGWSPSPTGRGSHTNNSDADADGYTICTYLAAGEEDLSWDAGMYQPGQSQTGSLGDRVWDDQNRNGVQDSGEPGLSGVTVRLLDCDGNTLAETSSDGNGQYRFVGLSARQYRVRFLHPNGWTNSPRDRTDDARDSDADDNGFTTCFGLDSGEQDGSRDAGMYNSSVQPIGCTRTKEYWQRHAGDDGDPDMVSRYLPIALGRVGGQKTVVVTGAEMAYEIFKEDWSLVSRKEMLKLYAQLLAAKLNIRAGADAGAIDEEISDVDGFLAVTSLDDFEHLSESQRRQVEAWRKELERYNRGDIGPGACDSGDDD